MPLHLLFCADYFDKQTPDAAYEEEVRAIEQCGLPYSLLDFEALVEEHNPAKAVRRVPSLEEQTLCVYRGWMMTPSQYARLYQALADRNLYLINTPAAYEHCHYLPASYDVIAAHTPRTVWIEVDAEITPAQLSEVVAPFGTRPLIVKDWVKSRKHEWLEACYIPAANDLEAVERVTTTFLKRQGADLNKGLVFREYVPFAALTTHSRSGMPLTKEFRYFCVDGTSFFVAPYWEEGEYGDVTPPANPFPQVLQQVRSRFFTMDVAQTVEGEWLIVELGDGQVAGLPDLADRTTFYQTFIATVSV